MSAHLPAFVAARRSIRSFSDEPVSADALDALVESACLAPAPHHSRPWRFAIAGTPDAKSALAQAMGDRWRIDLTSDGVASERVDRLVAASRRRIEGAPAVVLGCLTGDGLDRYPDAARQQAEWAMALLSLGAAVENLLLAATDAGLAACWVAAPGGRPPAPRAARPPPPARGPQAMVLVGHPDPSSRPPDRPPVPLDSLRVTR